MESKREDGMANMREMRSIRRESFIEAYGIKEVQDEAGSSSSEDNNYQLNDVTSPTKSGRQSITIDDLSEVEITDIDITGMDISLLEFDESNTSNELNNNKDDPFKEYSAPISPPNFAGGATRRKGSQQRRMMQRLGSNRNSNSFGGENRRASTGEMDASMTGSFAGSFVGSFGGMSINSFSASKASGENAEVGVGSVLGL